MRLGYLVLVHRESAQVERLLRALQAPGNACWVHVDAKAPQAVHAGVAAAATRLPRVTVLPSRPVYWAGYSVVDATLRGIRAALGAGGWDYLTLLSGQDFPLETQPAIAASLRALGGRSLLDARRDDVAVTRLRRFAFELPGLGRIVHLPRIPRPPPPPDLAYWRGSQWWTLSRRACAYVAGEAPEVARLRRLYAGTYCPDEGFFQTALLNGPLREEIVREARRYLVWQDQLHGPRLLDERDYEAMTRSGALFARKFAAGAPVLELLERRLARAAGAALTAAALRPAPAASPARDP